MSEHRRSDPSCMFAWRWTLNQRPWWIPEWVDRRWLWKSCTVCLVRYLDDWEQAERKRGRR